MTNREKLGQELLAMSNAEFAQMLRDTTLSAKVEGIMCSACEKANGGCPVGDDDCPKDIDEWLAEECTTDRILD